MDVIYLQERKKVQAFTCAVQMLLVALSLRMCCSLVCKASRNTSFPAASLKWKYAYLKNLTLKDGNAYLGIK